MWTSENHLGSVVILSCRGTEEVNKQATFENIAARFFQANSRRHTIADVGGFLYPIYMPRVYLGLSVCKGAQIKATHARHALLLRAFFRSPSSARSLRWLRGSSDSPHVRAGFLLRVLRCVVPAVRWFRTASPDDVPDVESDSGFLVFSSNTAPSFSAMKAR